MNHLSSLSYQEINNELTIICDAINLREIEVSKNSGVNTNSFLSGLANGALSVETDKESLAIYKLKQELMVRSGGQMKEARERNLARRAARKAERTKQIT
jgi:hypothetical protein